MKKERGDVLLEIIAQEGRSAGCESGVPADEGPAFGGGIIVGVLSGFGDSGEPRVIFPGAASGDPVTALSIVALRKDMIGRQVALQFEWGDLTRPVILGLIQRATQDAQSQQSTPGETKQVDVELDGERLVFTAEKEIVLRCGKSSITLTRAGKVLIRGAYVLSRSSGVNRIKGGSVQIN